MTFAPLVALVTLVVGLALLPQYRNNLNRPHIVRLDATFDDIVPQSASIEVLGSGFIWTEGPARVLTEDGKEIIVFSDTKDNIIYSWDEENGINMWRVPSGQQIGVSDRLGPLLEPGTNGLLYHKPSNQLIACDHGHRRISVVPLAGSVRGGFGGNAASPAWTLTNSTGGKRYNSPNDLAFRASSGTLYFTDPSYGLVRVWGSPIPEDTPDREITANCVYAVPGAAAALSTRVETPSITLTCGMKKPNGIGLSPDGSTLYVSDSSRMDSYWNAFTLSADGTSINSTSVFASVKSTLAGLSPAAVDSVTFKGSADGLEVDTKGNVYATAPGGVWVFSPSGRLLGLIALNAPTGNVLIHKGYLYIAADTRFLRVKVNTIGTGEQ